MRRVATGVLALGLLASTTAVADELQEIVAKNVAARGGLEKLKRVHSVLITGRLTFPGAGMEAPLVMKWKAPNKIRSEFTFQGMTAIQAYDGEKGWAIMPFQGSFDPEPASAEDLKQLDDQSDFIGPFVDTEKKGYKLDYLGKEEVEGKPAHKIEVTNKNGDVTLVYLQADSMLEIKSEIKRVIHEKDVEIEISQGDYKDVGGLMLAHSYESKPKGMPAGQTVVFDRIELNPEIQDGEFAMPAAKPAEKSED